MSKVDDMTPEQLEEVALRFHNHRATHPCEHGHPEHSLEPGGPCLIDAINRYLEGQLYGAKAARRAFHRHFGDRND